jgi:hypothetical protein
MSLPTAKTRRSLTHISLQLLQLEEKRYNVKSSNKKTCNLMLVPLIKMLYRKNYSINNKLPLCAIANMYKAYRPHYPWLTKDMLKSRLKHLHKINNSTSKPNDMLKPAEAHVSTASDTLVDNSTSFSSSTIFNPTSNPNGIPKSVEASTSNPNAHLSITLLLHYPHPHCTPTSNPNNMLKSTESVASTTDDTIVNKSTTAPSSTFNNLSSNLSDMPKSVETLTPSHGRPIGIILDNMTLTHKCIISAQAEIMHLYNKELIKTRALGKPHVNKGEYIKIHDNIKIIRNLPKIFELPYNNEKKDYNNSLSLTILAFLSGIDHPFKNVKMISLSN